ncbi:MAG TPA: DUF3592 domain-containing protein [Anaerolineae bacterium]|nr:DUF3592 domain-containing protein [Anaerolineae bacterium]HQH38310.1 DUF3592 domain-containing protein [Anaerolineae bacterium]
MLVILLVLLTMTLPVFLYGTFYVARGILRGLRSVNWHETSGEILFSKVEQYYRGRDVARELFQLSYSYRVDDVGREGHRWSYKSYTWLFGDLHKLAAKYAQNYAVTVYYDPLHPENAVLEKGTTRADIILLGVLALIDAGILLIWIPLTPVLIVLGVALMAFLVLLFRQLKQNKEYTF